VCSPGTNKNNILPQIATQEYCVFRGHLFSCRILLIPTDTGEEVNIPLLTEDNFRNNFEKIPVNREKAPGS
jgi:hypothetical protein